MKLSLTATVDCRHFAFPSSLLLPPPPRIAPSHTLIQRIHLYFSYRSDHLVGIDEDALLHGMPVSLRCEVVAEVAGDALQRAPFFAQASAAAMRSVQSILHVRLFLPQVNNL